MAQSATKKPSKKTLPVSQFVAIIVLSISVFLIVDFGRRAATGYRIHQEEQRLEAEYQELQSLHENLKTRREYVQSDRYIEEIARNELKWSRPGENVVVVVPPKESSPPTQAGQQAHIALSQPLQSPFEAWKSLYFPQTE